MSAPLFDKTVMIVEDDLILAELFDEILNISFCIKTAHSISDAMACLQNTHIDAVVSDFHLGTQNADVIIDWILQKQPELASRTILMTGECDATTRYQNKIAAVLFKPVDFNTLTEKVASLFVPQELQP